MTINVFMNPEWCSPGSSEKEWNYVMYHRHIQDRGTACSPVELSTTAIAPHVCLLDAGVAAPTAPAPCTEQCSGVALCAAFCTARERCGGAYGSRSPQWQRWSDVVMFVSGI